MTHAVVTRAPVHHEVDNGLILANKLPQCAQRDQTVIVEAANCVPALSHAIRRRRHSIRKCKPF